MEHIGMFDAKTHFSEIVDRVVRDGRGVTVTRRGKPVVDIVPTDANATEAMTFQEAVADLAKLREEFPKMSREEIVELISEGRR